MARSEVSSEDRLCLLLAAAQVQPWAQERALALLEGPLQWELIRIRVVREGILPIFFLNLRRLGFPGVPADVRTWLETAYKANAIRNEYLAMELARVLKLFDEAGIPVIPLKGVALSQSLYGDASLRVCADLDVLVPRSLVARSFQVLLRDRYAAEHPEEILIRIPLGNAIEYPFRRSDGPFRCRLELHWGLFCGSFNDENAAAEIWRESKPDTFFGVTARRLPPEWELLYLAAHAVRHRCEGLKWLADIHDSVSLRPVDWERLGSAARRHGWESAMTVSLGTCNAFLGTRVPREFMQPPRQNPFSPLGPSFQKTIGIPLFIFRHLTGARARLSFLFRRAFLPNFSDYSLVDLPHSFGFLYYVIRPFRVACRCGFLLLRFARVR
jgi:hypothetical protein